MAQPVRWVKIRSGVDQKDPDRGRPPASSTGAQPQSPIPLGLFSPSEVFQPQKWRDKCKASLLEAATATDRLMSETVTTKAALET